MTAALFTRSKGPGRLRLAGALRAIVIGSLCCLTPVTAILALGWVTRQTGWRIRQDFGRTEEPPGWVLGPNESGRIARLVGGLSRNIRAGMMTLTAALVWTLPFSLLWLGAWWAGWENSFNKGYEQAAVGPVVFLFGLAVSVVTLPLLPGMFAHLAAENRLAAAFELRRLRSVAAQAGWRLVVLALVTVAASLPVLAARGMVALGPELIPRLEEMSPAGVAELKAKIALVLAAWVFLALLVTRSLAARFYARSAAAAAARRPGLWDGTIAAEAAGPRIRKATRFAPLWPLAAGLIWALLGVTLVVGQFLDHSYWRWLLHPALVLPWAG